MGAEIPPNKPVEFARSPPRDGQPATQPARRSRSALARAERSVGDHEGRYYIDPETELPDIYGTTLSNQRSRKFSCDRVKIAPARRDRVSRLAKRLVADLSE